MNRSSSARFATLHRACELIFSYSDGARHNKYAINKTQGVHDSIIPKITASMVVTVCFLW